MFPKITLPQKPVYQKVDLPIGFFELFERIEQKYDTCFILESLGDQNFDSRYSVMGFNPQMILRAKGNNLEVESTQGTPPTPLNRGESIPSHSGRGVGGEGTVKNTVVFNNINPYWALREIVPQNIIARSYAGGLVGYLAYESVNYLEPKLNLKEHPDFHQFQFGVYTDGLVYDEMTGEITYFYYHQSRLEEVLELAEEVDLSHEIASASPRNDKVSSLPLTRGPQEPATGVGRRGLGGKDLEQDSRLRGNDKAPISPLSRGGRGGTWGTLNIKYLGDSLTKEEHARVIEQTIEEIKAGNSFQCEVGFKSKFKIQGNGQLKIYERLREVNPSPYMFYSKFDKEIVLGASPELLFRAKDGEVETFPLAGTVGRGETPEEDQHLAKQLLNDPKEVAEHNMLVDLHRNDIGKVSRFGTVKVRRLMDIKKFSHVQHICSEITGILKPEEDMFTGLASVFPGGVLTGAPKIETMKIIQHNEQAPRGPYGGAFGHFGFNGDATFCIPIRSLFISGEQAFAQTSSGVVYDSVAENEYNEVQRKLAAMKKVLEGLMVDEL